MTILHTLLCSAEIEGILAFSVMSCVQFCMCLRFLRHLCPKLCKFCGSHEAVFEMYCRVMCKSLKLTMLTPAVWGGGGVIVEESCSLCIVRRLQP